MSRRRRLNTSIIQKRLNANPCPLGLTLLMLASESSLEYQQWYFWIIQTKYEWKCSIVNCDLRECYTCLILALIFFPSIIWNRVKIRRTLNRISRFLKTTKIKLTAHKHNIHIHEKFLTHFRYLQTALKPFKNGRAFFCKSKNQTCMS